jgi:hypothetical protein
VEGVSDSKQLRRQSDDGVGRFVGTTEQFSGGNSQNGYASFCQPSLAFFVSVWAVGHIVCNPIDLDGEFCFCTVKIEHVRTDRMLSAEYWLSGKPSA